MFEGEYTHEGDQRIFEVMIIRLGLQARGLSASEADDGKRMEKGNPLIEYLYAYFRASK